MLVRCPKCETGFNLPAEKVPDKGAKVKCSACVHTFRVRVGDDGKPVYFYKKNGVRVEAKTPEPPGGQTQLGGPLSEILGSDHENEAKASAARSKSAQEGYNPFPLAGTAGAATADEAREEEEEPARAEAEGGRTQMFTGKGPPPTPGQAKPGATDNDKTKLGPAARARADEAHTPAVDVSDEGDAHGNATQAFGSGGAREFDIEVDDSSNDVSTAGDFDPFGDAFEEPIDADVGLLMPSTPSTEDEVPVVQPDDVRSLEESSAGLSEEDFLRGGKRSNFGAADELVDPMFGDDIRAFDPTSDAMETQTPTKRKTSPGPDDVGQKLPPEELELKDVRKTSPPKKSSRKTTSKSTDGAPKTSRKEKKRRPVVSHAPHRVGADSPIRRAFDIAFITLAVLVASTLFVSSRTAWTFDFSRPGHMLEVAFGGEEFEPPPEWATVVEVKPAEPPPDEPLRLRNVRAFETVAGEDRVLIVTGTVRNYSLEEYDSVTLRAEVLDANDEVIAEQTGKAGQTIDREALATAKSAAEVTEAIEAKLPGIGEEGAIHFAFVFEEIPADVAQSGAYDYRVAITEPGS